MYHSCWQRGQAGHERTHEAPGEMVHTELHSSGTGEVPLRTVALRSKKGGAEPDCSVVGYAESPVGA